jgi:hypothetical protein
MMGTKERHFAPLSSDVSLEDLVPTEHFYRRLEAERSTSRLSGSWCVRCTPVADAPPSIRWSSSSCNCSCSSRTSDRRGGSWRWRRTASP